MEMVPPSGIAAAAFSNRFDTTCANCTWSMTKHGRASDNCHTTILLLIQAMRQQMQPSHAGPCCIGQLELRGHFAGEVHQLLHDLAADQRRVDDALKVAAAFAIHLLLLQQFCITEHVAERCVQLMRDACGDLREYREPVVAAHARFQKGLPFAALVAIDEQGNVHRDLVKHTYLFSAIAATLFTFGCGTTDHDSDDHAGTAEQHAEGTAEHDESGDASAVKLDNGQRWAANAETTQGIANMAALVNNFDPGTQPPDTLKAELGREFALIFERCTMTGEAHEQLHNYLIPIHKQLNAMNPADEAERATLKDYLATYGNYFQ
jgi:hypothetical protein